MTTVARTRQSAAGFVEASTLEHGIAILQIEALQPSGGGLCG